MYEDKKFKDEWTLIHYSAQGGVTWLLKWLHIRKANLNIKDKYGCTPLHYATEWACVDTCNFLICEVNVNININIHLTN
jgi:hypothetical protein